MSKAKSTLSKLAPVLHLERAEFEHIIRTLDMIGSKSSNARRILEAIDKRAGSEYAESLRIIRDVPESSIPKLLAAWTEERNTCSEQELYRTDARHAEALGLPVLASLCAVYDVVERAHGTITPGELQTWLVPILQISRGEATARIQHLTASLGLEVPGLVTIPARILERDLPH